MITEVAPKNSLYICTVSSEDAPALLEIYAPYVEHTAISFEITVPSEKEFAGRIAHTIKRYPYIAAVKNGRIIGYACTHPFVDREAYRHTAETTVYIRRGETGLGAGRLLYESLEKISLLQNVLDLYACIGVPVRDDEHLTHNSEEFHKHMGYERAGFFPACGYKFGRWYDMVWMRKTLGAHTENPMEFVPFCSLSKSALAGCGIITEE